MIIAQLVRQLPVPRLDSNLQPMRVRIAVFIASAALILGALPLTAAHGNGAGDMDMEKSKVSTTDPDSSIAIAHRMESYFRHPQYIGWNLAHTVLMVLAWCIAMPLALMLSTARCRYHLPAQIFFHILNGLGVFTAVVYNASTPDLYPNNSHHGLGWTVVGFTITWTIMSFYTAFIEAKSMRVEPLELGKLLSSQRTAAYNQFHDETPPKHSSDSSQETESNSATFFDSRSNPTASVYQKPELPMNYEEFHGDSDREPERRDVFRNNKVDSFAKSIRPFLTPRASKVVRFCQVILEKSLLLLGFAELMSGFIVSGGLFRNRRVFNGLAHYIKGGIFVWYGMLTLGRWIGAFKEFGWAWNVRPQRPLVSKWKAMVPSAEFTESFIIWLYGASNVFLEHLSNWGGEWTPSDLEHLSITILFFGGGLLGMFVESKWARDLANTTVDVQNSADDRSGARKEQRSHDKCWEEPNTYRIPLNPMPALTIMVLGMMMGAHHQASVVSTMLHAQWGGLFTAFALARGITYVTLYLKPPTSYLPSRPPSEIVASFCLCAGGILLMNSASDIVWAIESNGLDAMSIFTVSMGFTGVMLAWEVVLFAVKGWATRKERATARKSSGSLPWTPCH